MPDPIVYNSDVKFEFLSYSIYFFYKITCYFSAGETIAAPKVRRSESARAQKNYNLIEDIISDLRHLAENELEIR